MQARSSMGSDSRSCPRKVASPPVTVNFSFPASTEASVLFPEPFGPMMACTSPAFTSRSMPFNISFPATCARKFLTESISILLFLHS